MVEQSWAAYLCLLEYLQHCCNLQLIASICFGVLSVPLDAGIDGIMNSEAWINGSSFFFYMSPNSCQSIVWEDKSKNISRLIVNSEIWVAPENSKLSELHITPFIITFVGSSEWRKHLTESQEELPELWELSLQCS